MNSKPLNIVIPCYNPFPGWEKDLANNCRELKRYINQDFNLVLVNDASSKNVDSSHLEFLNLHIPNFYYRHYDINKGKGYALRKGVELVNSGFIIYTDIDFPYEMESMHRLLNALENGTDIAVGTRDQLYYENTPARRTLISKILRWHLRTLFRLPITDTQCGLKGFNQAGKKVFLQTTINRFLFDMEFIALASKAKDIVMEPVAVKLRTNVQFSRMNARILLREAFNFTRIFWLTHFKA